MNRVPVCIEDRPFGRVKSLTIYKHEISDFKTFISMFSERRLKVFKAKFAIFLDESVPGCVEEFRNLDMVKFESCSHASKNNPLELKGLCLSEIKKMLILC